MTDNTDWGLTVEEAGELAKYINEKHGWQNIYSNHQEGRKVIKYYSFTWDTRTNTVWRVEFWDVSPNDKGHHHGDHYTFRTEYGYVLKDKIYDWLKQPINMKKEGEDNDRV